MKGDDLIPKYSKMHKKKEIKKKLQAYKMYLDKLIDFWICLTMKD